MYPACDRLGTCEDAAYVATQGKTLANQKLNLIVLPEMGAPNSCLYESFLVQYNPYKSEPELI